MSGQPEHGSSPQADQAPAAATQAAQPQTGDAPAAGARAAPSQTQYVIRDARPEDLDVLAGFEVEIAVASFGAEAITDPQLHRRRISGALGKPGEITMVVVAPDAPGRPLGWAWMSARTNSLTGARYGNFRSLAVADVADRGVLGELLMTAILAAADRERFTQLTGKVHATNLGMRSLYRAFGFTATHITMEKRVAGEPDQGQPA
jgi:L-amino acid N-acyltransferase YncA